MVTPTHGRGPGVLVLHSGRGLTESVEALCAKLARQGFVALAVDLFDGTTPTSADAATAAKDELDDRRARQVLTDSVTRLRRHDQVSRPSVGVLGLGYGSEWACWLASAIPDAVAALVLFYGYRDVDWDAVAAPVTGHFAELDGTLPPSRVEAIREQLLERGVTTDFFVYPGTEPSFFELDPTARYAPEAAALAWERTTAFLEGTLYVG